MFLASKTFSRVTLNVMRADLWKKIFIKVSERKIYKQKGCFEVVGGKKTFFNLLRDSIMLDFALKREIYAEKRSGLKFLSTN